MSDRGFKHFDFDPDDEPLAEPATKEDELLVDYTPCPSCNFVDGTHAPDCLDVN